jgi:hypothetical protein
MRFGVSLKKDTKRKYVLLLPPKAQRALSLSLSLSQKDKPW